jgi:hypothetical protein
MARCVRRSWHDEAGRPSPKSRCSTGDLASTARCCHRAQPMGHPIDGRSDQARLRGGEHAVALYDASIACTLCRDPRLLLGLWQTSVASLKIADCGSEPRDGQHADGSAPFLDRMTGRSGRLADPSWTGASPKVLCVGFSVKLAPGVRIRASSRGVRTSIGPRAARVHIGGGRTGISTGVGPVGLYTSLGGGRRGGGSRGGSAQASYQRQLAAQQRQAAQADRVAIAQQLADAFLRILNLHRVDFPNAQRPIAPEPTPPDRAAIYQHYEKQVLAGISVFKRAERTSAKQQAAAWADTEAARQWTTLKSQQARWQQTLDQQWQSLVGNDPDTVLQTLAEAFEDNEAASAAVGVDADEVSLVVLVPPASQAIPEQMPGRTAAGNLSLKKITQADRADFFKQFVCGQILVTLREAFAVAPGLNAARVIVLRNDGRDLHGRPNMPCLAAVSVTRRALKGVRWHDADAIDILNAAAHEKLITQKGQSKELSPLDLTNEAEITALINAVDLEELTAND